MSAHALSLKRFSREMERAYLLLVIEATGGDRKEAARILRISPATLYRRLGVKKPHEQQRSVPGH